MNRPFHYAFKVKDLESTRHFYGHLLGCKEGRSTEHWVDFDFFGNQISAHVSDEHPPLDFCGKVDGVGVPIPHFGAVLAPAAFDRVEKALREVSWEFLIEPTVRYAGKPGQQRTLFLLDPSGNPLEFKSMAEENELFSGGSASSEARPDRPE